MKRKFVEAIIQIRPSKILKGEIGVFAVRNLKKGSVVGATKLLDESLFFTWNEYKKIDKISQNVIKDFCIGTEKGFYAPSNINYISIPWNYNHSCSGNIGFNNNGDFITLKNIKSGEELFYDYGLAESNPNFKMRCNCGSKKCRKIITGNDWKDPIFRKNNYEQMTPELKKVISQNKKK